VQSSCRAHTLNNLGPVGDGTAVHGACAVPLVHDSFIKGVRSTSGHPTIVPGLRTGTGSDPAQHLAQTYRLLYSFSVLHLPFRGCDIAACC
jgi:hypothetical protein